MTAASHQPASIEMSVIPPSMAHNELLDQSFVYQNRLTGAVSPGPLKARQLCRILCPTSSSFAMSTEQVITPDTQVFSTTTVKNNSGGTWVVAKTQPVLREACSQWYYHETSNQKKNTNGDINVTSSSSVPSRVQGPVTCRELARLVRSNRDLDPATTQVWTAGVGSHGESEPENAGSTWSVLQNMPFLMAAMEAFQDDAAFIPSQASYDNTSMTFQSSTHGPTEHDVDASQQDDVDVSQDRVQKELDAFLSSTAQLGPSSGQDEEEDDEGFQSDGGTQYVKDPLTGNFIHEALAPKKRPPPETTSITKQSSQQQSSKKRKKSKFAAKNAKCWIYLTGLPPDTTLDEVSQFGSKVGIIELDPETQRPKIKLYRHKEGPLKNQPKGDASICYARPESVDLALQILDDAPLRPDAVDKESSFPVSVQRAKFEQHGDTFDASKKSRVSTAKRKVARLAAIQAVGWDEDDVNGRITGGRKGLRIIVLKHMFDLDELKIDEDSVLAKLENEVRTECEKWGAVEKITIFSKNPQGIVVVKFTQPTVASTAVLEWDGRDRKGRRVEAIFWDGVTDFTVRDEENEEHETEQRLDEFGEWLEQQDVPDEFKLQVEGS